MFVTFGTERVNVFHKSIYCFCSLYHAYYSQITRQRAVLTFKFHLLKLWFHALIVLYKGFTDFTLLLTIVLYSGFKMIVSYGTHALKLARQGGPLTTAFRDWFLRR